MNKLLLIVLSFGLALPLAAQNAPDASATVGKINITTTRMFPGVVARKFPLKEGQPFTEEAYDSAQDKLHDLRLFKKLDFQTVPNGGQIDININAEDGYFFFPLVFFTGGDQNAFVLSLTEGNFFKLGELGFLNIGTSDNGSTFSLGMAADDNFLHFNYTNLDVTQRFYNDFWSSSYGVLSVSNDEGKFGAPVKEWDMRSYAFSMLYARSFGDFSAFVSPQFKHLSYSQEVDAGNHNQVSAGVSLKHNIRNNTSMGAWFGFGLSDKQKMLSDMPSPKYGYNLTAAYTSGGDWTGADYQISKFGVSALWQAELKQHHIFDIELKGQDSYGSPFSDEILSTDLLGGQGKYRRLIRGTRGAGASTSFLYYLLRGDTGLLAVRPFYELAYIYAGGAYRHHSGTGATLSYKFWRFPFPLGLNYTRNLSDDSNLVSFVVGGGF